MKTNKKQNTNMTVIHSLILELQVYFCILIASLITSSMCTMAAEVINYVNYDCYEVDVTQ